MVEIAMSKVRDAAKSRGRQAATRRRMLDVGGASAVGTSVTHGKSEDYEHEPRQRWQERTGWISCHR